MFGNWLNGVDKKTKMQIRVGTYALVWPLWNCRNDVIFNKSIKCQYFTGYLHGYKLNPQMVLPSTGGATSAYEFYVFPSKDGCTSYLRPMLLDVFKMHM
jgi:hypothetical protein